MPEDLIVIDGTSQRDTISALPENYLEALSAIQEQSFVEAGLDDPDLYGEAFTLKHRLSFFKTGLFAGLGDCLLTIVGMILYVLGKMGAVPIFGYERRTADLVLAFAIVTFPYAASLILAIRTLAHVSGTISKKMMFWLIVGFTEGSLSGSALSFAACYGAASEWNTQIYLYLLKLEDIFPLFRGTADFFWYHMRAAMVSAAWDELKLSLLISSILFFAFLAKASLLHREKNRLTAPP